MAKNRKKPAGTGKVSGKKESSNPAEKPINKDIAPLVEPIGIDPSSKKSLDIEQELSTIYMEDEDDGEPDMTRLEQAKSTTFRKVMVGLSIFLIVLIGISAVGYYFFGPKNGFTGEQVTLSVEGPDEIKSGERTTYKIKYRNASDTPLGTASLELRLPDSFRLLESDPTADDNDTWKIGSMPPWGRGEIELTGVNWAPLNREQDIQAIITYRPANFNSEFQKVATKSIRTKEAMLELEVETENASLPGNPVEIIINYTNTSEAPLENAVIKTAFPVDFIPESSTPEPTGEKFELWELGTLEEFGTGSILINGAFASEAYGNVTLPIEFGFMDSDGAYVKQTDNATIVEVLQGKLVAAMVLNGKSDSQAVSLGESLRYSVSYRNTGAASLGNVEVAVVIEASPSDDLIIWNDLSDELGGKLEGNKITWTEKHIESLGRLEENDEGVIDFTVPVASVLPEGASTDDWVISSWVETFVQSIDGDVINHATRSAPIVARVLSDTAFAAEARFYDENGLALGSGVIPPEVGKETTYRVFWTVGNTLHELSDLRISAQLPNNVAWNGDSSVSAGDLRYEATDRKMIWSLNWLPKAVSEVTIWFDVTIIPFENQREKIPTLVENATFEATDDTAEATILLTDSPLSTSLDDDELAQGKGRVR